jgi:Family of unknown function (DUF6252)
MMRIYCCLIFLSFISLSCKKLFIDKPPVLPAATTEGLNTFGCLLNEDVFLPKNYSSSKSLFNTTPYLHFSYWNGELSIFALKKAEYDNIQQVYLYANRVFNVGTYQLKINNRSTTGYSSRYSNEISGSFYPISDTLNSKLVISRLDTINGIVSGTFSFTFQLNASSTVNVTNGVFDLSQY